jgi:Spy/CpxP family protein refolding chaperone
MRIANRILSIAGLLLLAGATLALADPQAPGAPGPGGQGPGPGWSGHDGPGGPPCDCGRGGWDRRGFGPGEGFGGRPGMGPLGRLGFALHRLDLSAEQRDAIHGILRQQRDATMALRDKLRAERESRMNEPLPVQFDEAKVRARAETRAKLTVEMEVARARVVSQVLGVLTQDQRDELQKMRDERRERFEERWGAGEGQDD